MEPAIGKKSPLSWKIGLMSSAYTAGKRCSILPSSRDLGFYFFDIDFGVR